MNTGACKTASSLGVPVEIALEPRTRYFWRVTVMGDNGELVTSDTAWFETAKLDEPFTAQRISPCLAPDTAPYMRRAFEITGEVLSARAYFTGLGIYELYLNGEKANDEYLAPGCTAYDSWIQYQTYDVTDLVHTGENVIGAILGNGWAKGRFGFDGVVGDYETNFPGKPCNMYTEEYLLFGELHVTTTQGETVIVTDESWQCAPNPLTFGNIYDGERYDANLEIENWCTPSCTYANWQPVKRNTTTNLGAISARLSLPVKAKHIITPKQITTPKNELVFDLGQNITGWFTFMADLPQVSSCACRPASCCKMTASTAITCAPRFPNTAIFRRAKKPLFDRLRPSTASATSNSPAWQISPASRIFRRGRFIPTSSRPARSRPQTRRSTACT